MNRNALNAPAEPDAPPRPMSRRRVWLLCAVTAGGWTLCFAPLDAAALAYVILAPWAVAVAAGPGRTALWAGWLTGLAAAMIGGLRSIPVALASGVAIGMTESLLLNWPSISQYRQALSFAVIVVVLLASQWKAVWDEAR